MTRKSEIWQLTEGDQTGADGTSVSLDLTLTVTAPPTTRHHVLKVHLDTVQPVCRFIGPDI